ncbi:MAG: hypothetical protein PVH37_07120 [Desulfobacterales bacterium]|jgi:hypothetical protein
MLIYDDIYSWEGWGGKLRLASGKCRLRVFDLKKGNKKGLTHLKPMIVIVSDVDGSPMSVRSCSGHIATSIARQFKIKPNQMLFIEYYPQTVYGQQREHKILEKYDLVEFSWHQDKAIEPKWRTLKSPLLDMVEELVEANSPQRMA